MIYNFIKNVLINYIWCAATLTIVLTLKLTHFVDLEYEK